MFQMKEQDKTPEENHNEIEINNSPDRKFKVMVIKMFTELTKDWWDTVRSSLIELKNMTELVRVESTIPEIKSIYYNK